MPKSHSTIGILGGTFDPVHLGHLRMGLELQEKLQLAKVHIIPCYEPVHRPKPQATAEERLAMVACAVAEESAFYADPREILRKKPSYTIDTLREMRAEMPDTALCFLLGIDAFASFTSWHGADEILTLAHLVVAHRPQYELPTSGAIANLMESRLQTDFNYVHQEMAGGILFCPITALEISASEIRKQIALGKNPRYLLPDNVCDYLKKQGTYR